jgi:hypothetical protein
MKKSFSLAIALLAFALSSCAGNGLYPVAGRVMYRGEPAAGAVVFLRRTGADLQNEQTIMGIVQQDGSFTLVCGSLGSGAPPGDYDVLIEWKAGPHQAKVPDRLKGRYANPSRPLLHATIKAENNELAAFELTD